MAFAGWTLKTTKRYHGTVRTLSLGDALRIIGQVKVIHRAVGLLGFYLQSTLISQFTESKRGRFEAK